MNQNQIERSGGQPQNLDNERFNVVFSSLGYSMRNTLTVLSLSDGDSFTGDNLYKKFVEVTDLQWDVQRQSISNACQSVLIPARLASFEDGEYSITWFGMKYGVPVASFITERSLSLHYPLQEIFGEIPSSVVTRTLILEYLALQKHSSTIAEIEDALNINRNIIGPHLVDFSHIGLADYNTSILITQDGRDIVNELIAPIRYAFANQGQFLAELYSNDWQKYAPEAAKKYSEYADTLYESMPYDERKYQILDLIRENPGIKFTQIAELHGKRSDILQELIESSLIVKRKDGKVAQFFIAKNSQS